MLAHVLPPPENDGGDPLTWRSRRTKDTDEVLAAMFCDNWVACNSRTWTFGDDPPVRVTEARRVTR